MKKTPLLTHPRYGFAETPFGECCMAFSNEGICSIIFSLDRKSAEMDIKRRFQGIVFEPDNEKVVSYAHQIFDLHQTPILQPIGTDFQLSVWQALLEIPFGKTSTYAQIARAIGRPEASRAVGTAIGANPIAFLIPCHRVIRTDGSLGGFRWGLELKKKMLLWENNSYPFGKKD